MKKVRFSGFRKFIKGRGFAAALVLSITAVGVSAYIAYDSAVDRLSDGADENAFEEEAAPVENPQSGIPRGGMIDTDAEVNATGAVTQSGNVLESLAPDDIEEANRFVSPKSPKVMPVDGEIINAFSNGELVKSNTLGVWRTHNAVDIASAEGTEVKAMEKGTVSEVYTNAMWGVCVTIDHGDGVVSSYMGLDKDVKVEEGNEVQAGDVIALVGKTAEAEIADPPHLHFAVRKNDSWIDPIAYIDEQ